MWRIVLGHIFKLLIAVAPFAIVPWWMRHRDWWPALAAVVHDDKATAEKLIVSGLTVADLLVLSLYEFFAHVRPRMDGRAFGRSYTQRLFDEFSAKCREAGLTLGRDVRVNVMILRWWLVFRWFANKGFVGGHRDDSLVLLRFQGICGHAFRHEKLVAVDFRTAARPSRWKPWHNFWLWPWQCTNTGHLTAIVSIPIFREAKDGAMTRHRAVGVVNIDAVSDAGADWILKEKEALKNFFGPSGMVIAHLATG
jgi:hypothetical protein